MRKLPLVIIFCLICSLILPPSTLGASKEYDHEALMQYDGYGKAMYETIVDETNFITGQYTDNKDFVNKSIDQIRDYGKFWWNEQNWDSEPWTYDRFKEMVAKPAGFLLTVGDWFGKLFNGYEETQKNDVDYDGYYSPYLYTTGNEAYSMLHARDDYEIVVGIPYSGKTFVTQRLEVGFNNSYWSEIQFFVRENYREHYTGPVIKTSDSEFLGYWERIYGDPGDRPLTVSRTLSNLSFIGATVYVREKKTENKIPPPSGGSNENLRKMRDFIDNGGVKDVATPQPRPYLSCPNGSKIQMSISGSTFLSVDGKAMIVNKDGTAQVDSAICKLGWDKPVVKYIDDRAAIQTPDGKWQDAETGKTIDEKEPDQEKEPNNPSCDISDEEMDIDSDLCEGIPYFGKKLEYIFGNATGNKHNIDRSIAMERQLNSIGIFDDATGRKLVLDNLSDAFDNPSSILKTQENGRIIRESLLSGPNGVLKVESVWDREKLITVKLYGGK
ncbi:hypothetical protein [Lysinibacillus sp. NPDC059133]|uniref:hypothetical protein n=1 Tax=Lysinibacillus sp. NPDC059133 TaxID=3346737 RepID=UPI00369659B3